MSAGERAIAFDCEGSELCGIVHVPEQPAERGVVVLVGGPQYRVGSHRQFVSLARALASGGHAVLRFDHRGIGDSEGPGQGFQSLRSDLSRAVDALFSEVPSLRDVVVWGLCDAASAALLFAHEDQRISGLVLLNPWIRTASSRARAYLRHYYLSRLFSAALWRKVLAGEFELSSSLRSFAATALAAARGGEVREPAGEVVTDRDADESLPARMAEGLARFTGPVLVILSGRDLTAQEFVDTTGGSPVWRDLLGARSVAREHLPEADHTFTRPEDSARVAELTLSWLNAW